MAGMSVALDANCFIDATKSSSHAYRAMAQILGAANSGALRLAISRHTLAELELKPDAALDLAHKCDVLPHFPVGSWDDQVATWDKVAGTWNDAERNHEIQMELKTLAKAGNDIRDRGAYIDALAAGVDVFITSDKQLASGTPAKQIMNRFGLRVVTPKQLAKELGETVA